MLREYDPDITPCAAHDLAVILPVGPVYECTCMPVSSVPACLCMYTGVYDTHACEQAVPYAYTYRSTVCVSIGGILHTCSARVGEAGGVHRYEFVPEWRKLPVKIASNNYFTSLILITILVCPCPNNTVRTCVRTSAQ